MKTSKQAGLPVCSDQGAITILVAVLIVAMLGLAAIVVDAGAIYSQRRQLQTAADAAALAGVQALPGSTTEAQTVAEQYAVENSPDAEQLDFEFPDDYTIVATVTDSDFGLFFARFMGMDSTLVAKRAVAKVGSPTTYGSGLMPFGIIANGTTEAPYGYDPGGIIPLVVDNGAQSQGNWHYVDLTDYTDGANSTKEVIANGGTTDPVSIGEIINTQTGSPNNPNYKALEDYFEETCSPHDLDELVYDEETGIWEPTHKSDGSHCNRLITCPVITIVNGDPYDWDSVTGNEAVRVEGFLNMFISNDPNFKDGELLAEFVQVVPVEAYGPGGYVDYAGIIRWLDE
jgi:hypothetical protein